MSYWDVAEMASDYDLTLRCAACAAQESVPDPMGWATRHQLELCGAPGWAAAWAAYREANPPPAPDENGVTALPPMPGRDTTVVSDAQILSAVRSLIVQGRVG